MIPLGTSVAAAVLALTATAGAPSPIPDRALTPGAVNPAVTQSTIYQTICVRGWTRTVRPPVEYTERIKRQEMVVYGYADLPMRDFELDHLIPLELGGAPADPRNLWPEPWRGVANAREKDHLENLAHAMVCRGEVSLSTAQVWFRSDWRKSYARLFGEGP